MLPRKHQVQGHTAAQACTAHARLLKPQNRANLSPALAWHYWPRIFILVALTLAGRARASVRTAWCVQSPRSRTRLSVPELLPVTAPDPRHCARQLRPEPTAPTLGHAKHGGHGARISLPIRVSRASLHSMKTAAQLALPREDRLAQGHHRDSARLYSRNDTYDSFRVQRRHWHMAGGQTAAWLEEEERQSQSLLSAFPAQHRRRTSRQWICMAALGPLHIPPRIHASLKSRTACFLLSRYLGRLRYRSRGRSSIRRCAWQLK